MRNAVNRGGIKSCSRRHTRNSLSLFFLGLALAACADSAPVIAPTDAAPSSSEQAIHTKTASHNRVLRQAEILAIALADSQFRSLVLRDLRSSRHPEKKLTWESFVALRLANVRDAIRRTWQTELDRDDFRAIDAGLVLYMPVREHRRHWRGDATVLVAVEEPDGGPIVAFSPDGRRQLLDPRTAPATPVLALSAAELSGPDDIENATLRADSASLAVALSCEPFITAEPLAASVGSALENPCDEGVEGVGEVVAVGSFTRPGST